MHIRFEELRERLLREGIAPQHVRRYLNELEDHYDDAVQDELSRSASMKASGEIAWQRLGDTEGLALSALARPELRSVLARYPRLIFGAGPFVLWFAVLFGTIWTFAMTAHLAGMDDGVHRAAPAWLNAPVQAIVFLYGRVLPIVFGGLAMLAAMRRRLDWHWPVVGAAVIALFAGTTELSLTLPTTIASGELQFDLTFIPLITAPFTDAFGTINPPRLLMDLAIGLLNFGLIVTPALLWRRRISA